MKIGFERFRLPTKERVQFMDITQMVKDFLERNPIRNGLMLLHSLHTTAVLFINEFQSALLEDIKAVIAGLVPRDGSYRHNDPRYSDCDRSNADSHLRAMLLSRQLTLPVQDGRLALGEYQSIIFAELDGPRERDIQFQVLGE